MTPFEGDKKYFLKFVDDEAEKLHGRIYELMNDIESYYKRHPGTGGSRLAIRLRFLKIIESFVDATATTLEEWRILLVDDDPDIANLYKLSLESDGFIVNTFNDPLLLLANYKVGEYDLLLFDIKMPHMDGFELYQKIRLVDDRTKICFISAFEEYDTIFKELFPDLKESDCFIRKPIDSESLTKKVNSRLRGE
jgi:two-component system response regulator ChvI